MADKAITQGEPMSQEQILDFINQEISRRIEQRKQRKQSFDARTTEEYSCLLLFLVAVIGCLAYFIFEVATIKSDVKEVRLNLKELNVQYAALDKKVDFGFAKTDAKMEAGFAKMEAGFAEVHREIRELKAMIVQKK